MKFVTIVGTSVYQNLRFKLPGLCESRFIQLLPFGRELSDNNEDDDVYDVNNWPRWQLSVSVDTFPNKAAGQLYVCVCVCVCVTMAHSSMEHTKRITQHHKVDLFLSHCHWYWPRHCHSSQSRVSIGCPFHNGMSMFIYTNIQTLSIK